MNLITSLICAACSALITEPSSRRRSDVYNDAPPAWDTARDGVVAEIANAAPIDDDQAWIQVAPYGEHPNRAGLQVFGQAQAERMVASFNSLSAKVGRLFRGAPIYAGHPDVDPGRWPDSRRLGKITQLEARNDGLYAKVEWNTLGVENSENGFYVYPSPRWLCEKGGKGLLPVELISVGLTNTPNIRSSAPVTANDEGAPGDEGTVDTPNDALVAMTAERDAALAQVTVKNDAWAAAERNISTLRAERDGLATQLSATNDALAAERVLRRDALLDHAVESGRITPADRPALVALFNTDWPAAEADVKGRQATYNTRPINLPKDRGALADAAERRTAQLEAVNSVMTEAGRTYDEAWELVRTDAKYKHLFSVANG